MNSDKGGRFNGIFCFIFEVPDKVQILYLRMICTIFQLPFHFFSIFASESNPSLVSNCDTDANSKAKASYLYSTT